MLAKSLRTAKERTLYKIALVFSLLCWALVLVSIIGAFYGLIIAAGVAVAHALWLAHVRGNGVRIDVDQLPQLAARIRRASAALGGHIKNNGDPGWIVLGRGFERFVEAEIGWRLARPKM